MKKFKILGIILLVVIIGGFYIWKLLSVPSVKSSEKKNIAIFVEKYLNEKYGEHNYKVTEVDYQFQMARVFDYSSPDGYIATVRCDIVNYFSVFISGIKQNEYKITSDSLLSEYYFPYLDGYESYEAMQSLTSVEKIQSNFFNKFKQDFEPSCQTLKLYDAKLDINQNFGTIPTMDDLKNDMSYYDVRHFTYTLTDIIENKEEYENKLRNYLKQNFGGEWSIHYNDDVRISCIRQ